MKLKLSLLFVLVLACGAAAQQKPTLKAIGVSKTFTDPGNKFSAAVPATGFLTDNEEREGPGGMKDMVVRYRWELREGNFAISTHTFEKDLYDNPLLIETLMATTANTFKDEGAEIISRASIEVGGVHGAELVRKETNGSKVIYRIFGWKNIMFTVNASFWASDAEAGRLMKAAVESLKFLELEKPVK